jgi:post-segregation antitoxin (ccd killing protein)
MGKEKLTIEVDAALMERLRNAGVDPHAYVERLIARANLSQESDAQRQERWAQLRAEEAEGLNAYDELIEREGLWSDGLRVF